MDITSLSLSDRYAIAITRLARSDSALIALIDRLSRTGAPKGLEKELAAAVTYLASRNLQLH